MQASPNGDPPRHGLPAAFQAHILLIEDDSALALVLTHTLARHLPRIKVTSACSVEQAWGIFEGGSVDVLITDLHLPGLDGTAFIRRIRERGWHQPVIVISGYGLEGITEVRELLQISAVLAKPFEMTALLGCIGAALNQVSQCSEGRGIL